MLTHVLWMIALGLLLTGISATVIWQAAGTPTIASLAKDMTLLELLRVALLVTGGIGGIVALVVTYRRQKLGERNEQREQEAADRAARSEDREDTKLFNERFAAASTQLGGESAMVRLAGVYAMATLADDWVEGRQMCVDVLCAYIRKPYTPPQAPRNPMPPEEQPPPPYGTGTIGIDIHQAQLELNHRRYSEDLKRFETEYAAYQKVLEESQVRATIFRVIRDHLSESAVNHWSGVGFDFSEATIDKVDLSRTKLVNNRLDFGGTRFIGAQVYLNSMKIYGSDLIFDGARFDLTSRVFASRSVFRESSLMFQGISLRGGVIVIEETAFMDSMISLAKLHAVEGTISVTNSDFTTAMIDLTGLRVSYADIHFCDLTLGDDCTATFWEMSIEPTGTVQIDILKDFVSMNERPRD